MISFLNMKGGVGKTTLAVNVAYGLSYFNDKDVLLVDVDPQFNATQYLVAGQHYLDYIEDEENLTITDIFRSNPLTFPTTTGAGKKEARPKPTLENSTIKINSWRDGPGKLDLIPSNLGLMTVETSDRGAENRLARFLDQIKEAYDFIIIDCPPTISIYTCSAFLASDFIVTPVKPDYLSSIGLPLLDSVITKYERDYNKKIIKLGVIFNMVNTRHILDRRVMQEIRVSGRPYFTNYLRNSTTIARAVRARQPIYRYKDSKRKHGPDINNICNEMIQKMENAQ
ncbi:MAG: ParA family protein [Deltaproteobacteria bacterium]|nr:ParA family protein [Deltaproteobacteria bacterium]